MKDDFVTCNFFGNEFLIDRNVLVPRKKTESTTRNAITEIKNLLKENQGKKYRVVDMGTGSGAIIISIANEFRKNNHLERLSFVGIDISEKALNIARLNCIKFGLEKIVELIKSDLNSNLSLDSNDIIVVNLPYLPKGSKVETSVANEPSIAVFDSGEGYELVFRLIETFKEVHPKIAVIENAENNIEKIVEHCSTVLRGAQIKEYYDAENLKRGVILKWM